MESTQQFRDDQKTVLVVDDDDTVLSFVCSLLAKEYNVFCSGSADQALQQSRAFRGDIDLLLSDFQMPGMTGIDLATAITVDRPHIKVLLMSGFTGGMLVLNEGWHFLPKPFIPSQLRALVSGLVSPDQKSKFSA